MAKTLIQPYAANAKKHPDTQLRQIAASLKEFGWQQPIVTDKNDVIIVGHDRWFAYQKYPDGIKDPWVVKAEDLTPLQVKAYRLADNKLNESKWDMDLAIEELRALTQEGYDISLTGFDADLLIEPDDRDDVLPENPPAIAQNGDVWSLGPHRVLCGDSTDGDAVARLLDGAKVDMVFTDPPYNVNYQSASGNSYAEGKFKHDKIFNDNKSDGDFYELLLKAFENMKLGLKAGAGVYIFHATSSQRQFEDALLNNGFYIKTTIIWNKPSLVLGWGDYKWKHEPCFYAALKGKDTVWYGGYDKTSVIDFHESEEDLVRFVKKQRKLTADGKTTIWNVKRDNTNEYKHPTQKPVEVIQIPIFNSSKEGDIILDLFLGSGSTLIASEKTGRVCYGMELDPRYIDVIIKRWEDYTGNTAVKL